MATPFDRWTYQDAQGALSAELLRPIVPLPGLLTAGIRTALVISPSAGVGDPVAALDKGTAGALTRAGGAFLAGVWGMPTMALLTAINRRFVFGDHWQGGAGWIGPKPQPGDPGFSETMLEIRRAFTSRNVIGEVVGRHMSGVIGREPRWGLALRRALKQDEEPSAAEQALIDEAEALLTVWWDARKVMKTLQRCVVTMLYAERAPLRLYVPPGMLEDQQDERTGTMTRVITADSVEAALTKLWLEDPIPEQATVATDDDTKQDIGVFVSQVSVGATGEPKYEPVAELTYADGDKTVVRMVDKSATTEYRLAFGGRLTMFEPSRTPIVSPQVQESQRALNLALSMLPRNVVTGGFLERILLNAQMPGTWETDAQGNKKFIPEPYFAGAGTTNFVQGVQYEDGQGKTVVATPSVQFREPVPVAPSVDAKRSHYEDILEEVKQAHVLMNQDARASGKSREQARADYEADLLVTKTELEAAGRWVLETVLAMAEAFAGSPGKYTEQLRATFACQIDTGPLTAQERAANDASVGKTLSRETAMERNGVADVDAELQRMNAEPAAHLDMLTKQSTIITNLTTAGATLEAAATVAELDEDQIKELTTPETFTAPVTQ